jgi:hypothetical protein
MKLPRVHCPSCERPVAARPVPGQLTKGTVWRHDAPTLRRDTDGRLLSCGGSLEVVDLPIPGQQLTFDVETPEPEPLDTMALF